LNLGISQEYLQRDGVHIPFCENRLLVGNSKFASINAHLGLEQSRRDDMESLSYLLLYFVRGGLP